MINKLRTSRMVEQRIKILNDFIFFSIKFKLLLCA